MCYFHGQPVGSIVPAAIGAVDIRQYTSRSDCQVWRFCKCGMWFSILRLLPRLSKVRGNMRKGEWGYEADESWHAYTYFTERAVWWAGNANCMQQSAIPYTLPVNKAEAYFKTIFRVSLIVTVWSIRLEKIDLSADVRIDTRFNVLRLSKRGGISMWYLLLKIYEGGIRHETVRALTGLYFIFWM